MDERRSKGPCFNCVSKYSKGHNCGENKLFYIDCEEEEEKEQETHEEKENKIFEKKRKKQLKKSLPPYLVISWYELLHLKP